MDFPSPSVPSFFPANGSGSANEVPVSRHHSVNAEGQRHRLKPQVSCLTVFVLIRRETFAATPTSRTSASAVPNAHRDTALCASPPQALGSSNTAASGRSALDAGSCDALGVPEVGGRLASVVPARLVPIPGIQFFRRLAST